MKKKFNFSAGPSMLPESVLNQIKEELLNWNNLGISVMEISHRSSEFEELAQKTQRNLRILLDVPSNYTILFCQGGARAQFSAIPMNLLKKPTGNIDYINTGYWGYRAAIEAQKFCNVNIVNVLDKDINGFYFIKPINEWNISKDSLYIHYCPNETISGISINDIPIFSETKILIADCSSMLLSQPIDINRFGIIYASAQKNIGVPGLTVVIIRNDLIFNTVSNYKKIPAILDYEILLSNNSMFNTPVTISWYIANLVLEWLKKLGGLSKINEFNKKKSALLYKAIDDSDCYYNNINYKYRSIMNVPFFLKREKLTYLFLEESKFFGLYGLKGHKIHGGIRASIYNAMTLEGVLNLIKFMNFFSRQCS
ncbi:phosphoserine aminotransferase [Candidatus Blochmanniella vafra str. BVAF]|uniref:Phosphoserine aminotransferase n=1 Tax=Blochmanniella vafra (strain BVAF) TaxID=859654 RepID=E8Q685_BLOVB|nr:3-phosphoserine/phosphohydroxythreonine transaminase [Candidatus Blochmannia vafer]ADV33779.1 phosphoserine aminotransferase [Candidatus Blochmannia vafer str. BVAF]